MWGRQPPPLAPCAFWLDQFQDFGCQMKNFSKVGHGKGHLPPLFSGPQPVSSPCRGRGVHAQVSREAATGRHAHAHGLAVNWRLAVENLHGCKTESEIWLEKLNFFSRILAAKDTLCAHQRCSPSFPSSAKFFVTVKTLTVSSTDQPLPILTLLNPVTVWKNTELSQPVYFGKRWF